MGVVDILNIPATIPPITQVGMREEVCLGLKILATINF